jgi:hypothetical protein
MWGFGVVGTVVVAAVVAFVIWSESSASAADAAVNAAKVQALARCEGHGAAEDVEGSNRVFYACGDGRYGYIAYSVDQWGLW